MNAPVRIIARWPEMMLQKDAAEYCGLSIAAFEREVYARRLPAPVRFGGKDHWRKAAIDAALDVLTGDVAPTGDDAPWRREMKERYARKNA
jgi:predicted DNA-binding transcriptional regulator AlpA